VKRFLVCFIIGLILTLQLKTGRAEKPSELEGVIDISGAWALYPMMVKWAEEFQSIHPNVKINISAGGAGKGMADCLAGVVDLGMISRDINDEEIKKGAWWISVVIDAVVPTVNENNPILNDILKNGIKREAFIDIWVTKQIKTWGEAAGNDAKDIINVYTRSDACGAAETWAKYLDKKQEDLEGVGVYGDPGIAEVVKKDILGIGYNNINFVYDANTKRPIAGIKVIALDIDGNGRLDTKENFYDNRDQLIQAIRNGKYPSPPARKLYLASQGKPKKEIVLEFLGWILADGQKFVSETGYINLPEKEIEEELNRL